MAEKRPTPVKPLTIYFYHTRLTRESYEEWKDYKFPGHILYGLPLLEKYGIRSVMHKYKAFPSRLKLMLYATKEILCCKEPYEVLYGTSFRGLELIILLRALGLYRKPIVIWHHTALNKWGAMVLLSRVYLYKGENANALKMASDAIIGAEKNKYALWTNEDYPTAWGEDASASKPGEVLFEIVNLTTDSPGKESMGYLNSYDGYDDMCITCSFYQFLKEDPKDIRLKLLSFDKKYYAYVNKYQPQREENIEDANIPLIRLSEAYLNAAEAAVKENDNDAAVKYLDPIVKRANPDNTVVGQTITLERVLNERRKELVAEGHRMYDVIRNGLTVERKDVKDSNLSKTKHDTKYMTYDWNFYMIVLPIPKKEMDANPNMEQNPEYGGR